MRLIQPALPILAGLAFDSACVHANPKVPDLTKGEKPVLSKDEETAERQPWSYWPDRMGLPQPGRYQFEPSDSGDRGGKRFTRCWFDQEGDVILGASGKLKAPAAFSSNARKSFALTIAEAEARDPALLHMKVWRQGKTANLSIKLQTMGAYSATAPYRCPKSRKVITRALKYLESNESKRDRFGLNILSLLACDDESFPGERLGAGKRGSGWSRCCLARTITKG